MHSVDVCVLQLRGKTGECRMAGRMAVCMQAQCMILTPHPHTLVNTMHVNMP